MQKIPTQRAEARPHGSRELIEPAQRRLTLSLCWLFVVQDFRSRFSGNILGVAWAVVAPLLQLGVFYVVFLHIFKARVPNLAPEAYLVFLALGFWPWFAFSEAVVRAVTAIQDNAALTSKVALPRAVLIISRVVAAFILHGAGFVIVLIVLWLVGPDLHWTYLPAALALWLPMLCMAIGAGLFVASLQVFVRDLAQATGPILSLWFFLTPIIYGLQMAPAGMADFLLWNPLTGVVQGHRALLLFGIIEIPGVFSMLAGAVVLPILGIWTYRRTEPWFEDYL